jgi:hypothetical protein
MMHETVDEFLIRIISEDKERRKAVIQNMVSLGAKIMYRDEDSIFIDTSSMKKADK